jgi:hypothetical protein
VIVAAKARTVVDPATRLRELIRSLEPRLRRRFLALIEQVRRERSLPQLEELIRANRTEEALDAIDRAALLFAAETTTIFVLSAQSTAGWLRDKVGIRIAFDQTNDFAVRRMADSKLDLVRALRADQRELLREVMLEGVAEGVNPREVARRFRDSIGLTANQVRATRRYRALLNTRSAEALERELRDRRFDSRVRASVRGDAALTGADVTRMVGRYRDRFLGYRAEVIARTETLRVVHEGNEEMYRQAIEAGDLDERELRRQWNTALDARVRDTHRSMHRQTRPFGEPFVSGAGNRLRYPGDPSAPASDTVQCRCAVSTRIVL